jgi:UDP-N-acetylglucosamine 1-carboxyvinyltransferase
MRWIEVDRSGPLKGSVNIPGSKNSSLALLSACCLADEAVTLKNIPNISDIRLVCEIIKGIGAEVNQFGDILIINPANIHNAVIDQKKSSFYRAAYYFVGALLAKFKSVTIGYPGGDNFGRRPIDQHIKGLEALGAQFKFYEDHYIVEVDKLRGADIYFDMITSGATINVMLAAALAEGKTVLRNAARDPEVVDTAVLLNSMGAIIKGAGTGTITIQGVNSLKGCVHTVIPDRLVAGSFLMAAGLAGGDITVNNVIHEHLVSCTAKLIECGLHIEEGENFIRAYRDGEIRGVNVKAAMYPAFPTDLQQPLTSLLIGATSHSTIIDTVYPGRFNHCIELNKMGADIIMKEDCFVVPGNRTLNGAWVKATDVRAGISLILAGLSAKGTTYITGMEHIERGYADITETFLSLGANVRVCDDPDAQEASV